MSWRELKGPHKGDFLYRFSKSRQGCTFSVTDLINVWTETLSSAQVVQRATQADSVLVLETEDDMAEFLSRLGEILAVPSAFDPGNPSKIAYKLQLASFDFQWEFVLTLCPVEESREIVKEYTLHLLKSVATLDKTLQESKQLAHQLSYHLNNLARITHEPYIPRRYQQVYMDHMDPLGSSYFSSELSSSQIASSLPGPPSSPPADLVPTWRHGAEVVGDLASSTVEGDESNTTLTLDNEQEEEDRRQKLDRLMDAQLRKKRRL